MSQNTQASSGEPGFSPLRARFWPIHGYEMKKFLPMALIMFCLLFNYTVLRDTKDALVVNAAGAGAITFLKLYCVTPAAILFVILYAKLSNIFDKEKLFYVVVAPFLVFFGAFGFIIYPNLSTLHPNPITIAEMQAAAPYLSGFIDLYAYWGYSLFYVLSEIWGSAMISLLFWQFANQVTRMRESKRFYGLFVVVANVALIFSGQAVKFCSTGIKSFYPTLSNVELWGKSLNLLMGLVVVMGVACLAIYRWMHTNVLNDARYYDPAEQEGKKKKKEKPGLIESARIIFTSPELGLIAILIMAYGVTINLVEVQWKQQLSIFANKDQGVYNAFMGDQSTVTGFVTIFFSLFLGSNILRKMSWFAAAVITPAAIFVGGSLFFCFIFLKDQMGTMLTDFGTTPVAAATYLGVFIVIASKAIKYSLFDPTKEMAYIPLDEELKVKGKAAVDVIGGRAGKAGGAFVQSTLLTFFATKDVVTIAPQCFVTFAVVCVAWLFAVKVLSKKVSEAVARKEQEKAASATS